MTAVERIQEYLLQLSQAGLLRSRNVSDPTALDAICFDSNDYLSLTQDKRVATAYQEGFLHYPCGSGASMLVSGYHANHQAVERGFSDLLAVDECILFSSGYAANLAIMNLFSCIQIHCLIDKGIHASFYDGLKLSKVNFTRFKHNDLNDLSTKINGVNDNAVVLTEGIFSMSGQIAPLEQLAALSLSTKKELFVDEAHSFGVLGVQGKGAVVCHGLSQNEVPLRVIPLGKAFAAQAAIVAGKNEWITALLQVGRSIIYSTAVSPALCYGLLKTLDIVVAADERRSKLFQLIEMFKEQVKNSPLTWTDSSTPIQQLQLGCPHLSLHYATQLRDAGIHCSAIRVPTVTLKATGLRIILNYKHQEEHIAALFTKLHQIYENTLN
jgi:8-amino-7-oxononanoate synthase